VYPEVEDIEPWRLGMQGAGSGDSRVRQLWRSAAEFYTMREYVTGDDLRRIHWPSVARTGQLMIRQDESTRRSLSALFFDNRNSSLGANGSPAFERGVSAAATMGRLLVRAGYAVRFASIDTPPTVVTETGLLEMLSDVGSVRARTIREALGRLRASAQPESSLVLVSSPPPAPEIGVLSQIGTGFGRKLAVFIYPVKPSTIPPPAAAELEGRAKHARSSLARAGWDVILLQPDGRLADAWHVTASPRGLRVPVSSSS